MIIGEPDPERAGFDIDRLSTARNLVLQGIERGLYTGAALWASRGGVTAVLDFAGHTDLSHAMRIDRHTLFDLASLTKPVVTATCVLTLVDEGKLDLNQSVGTFFADRDVRHLEGVTLFGLLTHTSGLPAWVDLYGDHPTRQSATAALLKVRLENEPGTRYKYSCLGYILLGLVVEIATGERLDMFADRLVFKPLGMDETMFNPGYRANIAATGFCPRRGRELQGEVHDSNSCAFGGISGNAGLFSTVQDMAMFCHSVTFECNYKEDSPTGLANKNRSFDNALPGSLGGHTLGGWFVWPNPMLPASELVTKTTVGHSGFTGTAIMMDPVNQMCSVLLTNRTCRQDDGSEFRALRRKLIDALLGANVW